MSVGLTLTHVAACGLGDGAGWWWNGASAAPLILAVAA
jgi:hypothetical protein